ncbi:MAG TPA: hypothetical protein VN847_03955 [Streptosporangiaceae bacterium]|nr:hypothetical protein [Streptosporangiaceae bacterium]
MGCGSAGVPDGRGSEWSWGWGWGTAAAGEAESWGWGTAAAGEAESWSWSWSWGTADGLREFARSKSIASQWMKPVTNVTSFARTEKDLNRTLGLVRFLHGRRRGGS